MILIEKLKSFFCCVDKKSKCKYKHFKDFGEPFPKNLELIFSFGNKVLCENVREYKVYQCKECGKRVFSCFPGHLLPDEICLKVDAFIGYKIEIDELVDIMKKGDHPYKVYEEGEE